jgi:kynurenine formamidase
VLLHEALPVTWPGRAAGEQHVPYVAKALHTWDQYGPPAFVRTHVLDSQTGTHLIPPAYAAPPPQFDRNTYAADTRAALERFEQRYGALRPTETTADRVPLDQLIGHSRVIDVRGRVGTTAPDPQGPKPRSPVIRVADVEAHEQQFGRIRPGEIVLFYSGHSDRFCQPEPESDYCMLLPLVGIAEAWPAPDAETVLFLADQRGVRCIGTDGPSMGSADPTEALFTYWAAASRGVCFVEYLTNLGRLPAHGAYFLFGPVKILGSHGGHGRALALV